jgi:hypothetical protein
MFRSTGCRLAVSLLCFPAFPVLGQDAKPANPSSNAVTPSQAYTAEFKTVNVQTLANGTTITRETKEVRARDSQGRTLVVTTQPQFTNGRIQNPVDNTEIIWNSVAKSGTKKASVIRLPPQDQRHGCWASDSRRLTMNYRTDTPAPGTSTGGGGGGGLAGSILVSGEVWGASKTEHTHDALGTTTIQGLEAKGVLFTTLIPTGQVGNDSPITTTQELWRTPGFPFPLREVYDDPRTGKRTREVVSLTIGEPELSLFQPPEGYEVANEEMHEVPCQQ